MPHRFDPPYGTKDQHVTAPAQHFGYYALVAYLVHEGKQAAYIRAECAAAHEQQVPKDVVRREGLTGWHRRSELQGLYLTRRVSSYAAVLYRYNQMLAQERASR